MNFEADISAFEFQDNCQQYFLERINGKGTKTAMRKSHIHESLTIIHMNLQIVFIKRKKCHAIIQIKSLWEMPGLNMTPSNQDEANGCFIDEDCTQSHFHRKLR